jgi:hypothetical protein
MCFSPCASDRYGVPLRSVMRVTCTELVCSAGRHHDWHRGGVASCVSQLCIARDYYSAPLRLFSKTLAWLRRVAADRECDTRETGTPHSAGDLTGSRAPRAVPRCGRDARRAQSRCTVTRLEFCPIEKYRGSSGVARVSPWHAVEGYGRPLRTHTYAHATAHTHIHDERLRYLGALKCTAPSAPARRRIRKQSPHHAPLLRIAAPPCPFLPPPLPSARLSPPRVERHRRARRRRTANPPHPCRRRSRRGTTRPRTHAGLPHPPLHIILRRRPSPPPGSSARHNTLRRLTLFLSLRAFGPSRPPATCRRNEPYSSKPSKTTPFLPVVGKPNKIIPGL